MCEDNGVEAIAVQGDVSEWKDAHNLANKTLEKFGRIDLLVLNAGIWEGAPIEEMSEETWNKVLNTNLKAAWAMTKACVPAMKKQPKRRDRSGFFNRRTARRSELFKLRRVERRTDFFYKSSRVGTLPENPRQLPSRPAGSKRRWCARFLKTKIINERDQFDSAKTNGDDRRRCAFDLFSALRLVAPHHGRNLKHQRRRGFLRIAKNESFLIVRLLQKRRVGCRG